jgi:uncharacterized UBP type Zn finger protein
MTDPEPACSHLDTLREVTPSADGCEECLKIGSTWFHLRLCMSCGKVGCCDQSPNRHATAHVEESGHPIIRSAEPGEEWAYCYPDDLYMESLPR